MTQSRIAALTASFNVRAPASTGSTVEAGARTLKEAVSAAIRDWVTNVATTHYIIGSADQPSPFATSAA